jgi:type I restriction enzyme, S subunit
MPAHWELRRLKTISPEITVGIVVEPSKYYVDEGVPALRSLNVQSGLISTENLVFISAESNDLLSKSRLQAGDLVSVRSGQTGVTAVVPVDLEGCNCIDLIIIRKPLRDCERYLRWFCAADCARWQFDVGSGGAIQQHFNIGMAMNLVVALPPPTEQRAIADFLACEVAKLEALNENAESAIELLRERRSALITAAVTGQIDVRNAVPRPTAEPEPLAA